MGIRQSLGVLLSVFATLSLKVIEPLTIPSSDRSAAFSDKAKLFKMSDTYAVGNILV
jgi:hypothetical protein